MAAKIFTVICVHIFITISLVSCRPSDAVASHINDQHQIAKRQLSNEENVAFYALMGNFTQHASNHQIVQFENVITNIGQGYDIKTGVFTAPVSGVYAFSVTMMSDPGHFNKYVVAKNDVDFVNIVSDARGNAYATSTQNFVIYLNQGDTVGVKVNDIDGFVHGDNHSSFSGFLQQQSFPDTGVVGK